MRGGGAKVVESAAFTVATRQSPPYLRSRQSPYRLQGVGIGQAVCISPVEFG